jgi:hypothetical protein
MDDELAVTDTVRAAPLEPLGTPEQPRYTHLQELARKLQESGRLDPVRLTCVKPEGGAALQYYPATGWPRGQIAHLGTPWGPRPFYGRVLPQRPSEDPEDDGNDA